MRAFAVLVALTFAVGLAAPAQAIVRGKPVHGLALYGEPKYGPGQVPATINAAAPKGGTIRLNAVAPTYDSFNPFVIKGTPAAGLTYLGSNGLFYEGLTMRGDDEPFSNYCLVCETEEVAEDNGWVEFTLRPEARFHDGSPVTPEDVIFSFEILAAKGAPFFRTYWKDVAKLEKTGPRKVRIVFKTKDNAELPLIVGEIPVLSRAFWQGRDFGATLLEPPVATGPYRIEAFEQGRYIAYKHDPAYWGKDLVVTRGTHNFDRIRFDYFRDDDVGFEAFKAGQIDLVNENTALRWATGYDPKLIADGQIVRETFKDGTPGTTQGFVMNLRRAKFADARVREAFSLAFDFDWSNKTLAYGQYEPMNSYFGTSDLAASGLPQGEELQILERLRGKVPEEVFTKVYAQPRSDGTGGNRENLVKARTLLQAAGWQVRDGVLTNAKSGERFEFEFLIAQPSLEKWIGPYLRNLERLGIKGRLRIVDMPQYVNRITSFDFDMLTGVPRQSLSPGNEQTEMWGSAAADRPGSQNLAGIKDPAVDAVVAGLLAAKTRESLVAHTRALDRILLWNHYHVPQLSILGTRMAFWNKFGRPALTPLQGPDTTSWWYDDAKAKALDAKRRQGGR
jgi:microcin C transport system substrate-binding protein